MHLQKAIDYELYYRIDSYMEKNNLNSDEFALKCRLPLEEMERVLNKKTVSVSSALKICKALDIDLKSVTYPPNNEIEYKDYFDKMVEIVVSNKSQKEKIGLAARLRDSEYIDKKIWNRYCLWALYEVCKTLEEEPNR